MGRDKRNIDLEENRFELDRKKFRLEKSRFFVTTSAVAITLLGFIFGFYKFFDERHREYDSLYRSTLSKLLAGGTEIRRSALIEISKFNDRKDEYVPILINLMNDYHKENNRTLDKYLITAFIFTGKQAVEELAQTNRRAQNPFDEDLCQSTGWAICEILKSASYETFFPYRLSRLHLSDNTLSSLNLSKVTLLESKIDRINFDNSVFMKCDFSRMIIRDASFWKTKFSKDVKLEGARFINCNLQEAIFDCDLKQTEFQDCNVLDLQVADKKNIKDDTFSSCINSSSVKYNQH